MLDADRKGDIEAVSAVLAEAAASHVDLGKDAVRYAQRVGAAGAAHLRSAKAALTRSVFTAASQELARAKSLGADDPDLDAQFDASPPKLASVWFSSGDGGGFVVTNDSLIFGVLAARDADHFAFILDDNLRAEYREVAENAYKVDKYLVRLAQAGRESKARLTSWRAWFDKAKFYAPITFDATTSATRIVYVGEGVFAVELGRVGSVLEAKGDKSYGGKIVDAGGAFVSAARSKFFRCVDAEPGFKQCYFVLAPLSQSLMDSLGADPGERTIGARWAWTGFGAAEDVRLSQFAYEGMYSDPPFGTISIMENFQQQYVATAAFPADLHVELLDANGSVLWRSR